MKFKPSWIAAAPLSCVLLASAPALAQTSGESSEAIDEVVVTGSYIRRTSQFDSPSPIDSVDATKLEQIGAKNFADVIQTLTINTGSQNNPDAFTQNSTVGTSNFNLRGLGVASTLVLLNGKRQVLTGLPTNDGLNFVDTSSLVPMIAVDNIEILKDGAAALYGSDAVAGVVNFLTRDNFEGFEISADYQTISDEGDASEYVLQGLFGAQGDRTSLIAALSFTDRTPLTTAEKRLSRPIDDSSSLGSPGSYFIGATPFIDPTGCETSAIDGAFIGGIPQLLAPPGTVPGLDVGLCRFDFGDFFNLQADETRLNGYAKAKYQLTDSIEAYGEFSFARNRSQRGNSPTFPNLRFPSIPATHPNNPFGQTVNYFGRAIGNGGDPSPSINEIDTWRTSFGLEGELSGGWYWQVAYVGAKNEGVNTTADTLAREFQNALNGFGGTRCEATSPTAQAGVGPCQYFNPFASSFSIAPNSQDVINSFIADQVLDTTSELQTLDAVVSGEIFDMPAGAASMAFGVQRRKEELIHDYNSLANADRFAFVIGNPDFTGERDVNAAFVEFGLPLADNFDLQIALRYEDYSGATGTTTDPKIAGIWSATDRLTLRGSYSTSFRAPSLFQVNGGSTSLNQISDPLNPGTNFAAVRSSANPDLVPEESDAYNLGVSWEPADNLVLDLDYWTFEFTDVIIQENFQAVLNEFATDPTRVQRVAGPGSPVTQINVGFVNASSVETNGIDFRARYDMETSFGQLAPFIEGTYILAYDIEDPQAGSIDGAGRRNFTNFGTSTPELRFNAGLGWMNGAHGANLFVRYTSAYDDDQNCQDGTLTPVTGCGANGGFFEIDSFVSVDAQYSLDTAVLMNQESGPILTLGVINAAGEEPPQVFTNGGFDSKVHDPRGRMIYARLKYAF